MAGFHAVVIQRAKQYLSLSLVLQCNFHLFPEITNRILLPTPVLYVVDFMFIYVDVVKASSAGREGAGWGRLWAFDFDPHRSNAEFWPHRFLFMIEFAQFLCKRLCKNGTMALLKNLKPLTTLLFSIIPKNCRPILRPNRPIARLHQLAPQGSKEGSLLNCPPEHVSKFILIFPWKSYILEKQYQWHLFTELHSPTSKSQSLFQWRITI